RNRRFGLRGQVDKHRFLFSVGESGSEVDGCGGLPHPALLVGNRQDGSHIRARPDLTGPGTLLLPAGNPTATSWGVADPHTTVAPIYSSLSPVASKKSTLDCGGLPPLW